MNPRDVKEDVYVRPVTGSRAFPRATLYEIEEVTTGQKVRLRDCMVPVEDAIGDYGTLETSVMQIVQSMVVVEPEPMSGDDLLNELAA